MIEETLKKIEATIDKSCAVPEENRAELQDLLTRLKSEISELSKTHDEHARSIAGFTELSMHEATREEKNKELLKLSLEGLSSSVQGFEGSHPKLVEIVNRIAVMLANIGI
jgi:YesN/AraC family two-component response regulator